MSENFFRETDVTIFFLVTMIIIVTANIFSIEIVNICE